jgi:hypothetical protein
MKNIFIILLLVGCIVQSSAQGFLRVSPGATINTVNNAFIVLDNVNVINNGSFNQSIGNGTIKFTGNGDATISGSTVATFDKLNIAKTSSKVALQQNMNVLGQASFTSGMLDLSNSILNLGSTGTLNGETETSRIFTLGNGYVQIITMLNTPVAANPGNLGAIISATKNLGSVTIRRGHLAQANITGNIPGILRYYDILPAVDNGLKATLRLQYFDAELNGRNETILELYKQDKKGWVNIGYSSRSTVNNFVEKIGITGLSRWTLSTNASMTQLKTATNIYGEEISSGIKDQISVWPNPVRHMVNVNIELKKSSSVLLQVYDTKGSLVFVKNEKLLVGKNIVHIDMHTFSAGTYSLIVSWEHNKKVIHLIK